MNESQTRRESTDKSLAEASLNGDDVLQVFSEFLTVRFSAEKPRVKCDISFIDYTLLYKYGKSTKGYERFTWKLEMHRCSKHVGFSTKVEKQDLIGAPYTHVDGKGILGIFPMDSAEKIVVNYQKK